MDFTLSEEQRLLVENVRRFVEAELMPLEDEVEATGQLDPKTARVIFEKSKALGFYAMNIPEVYGGGGLSAVSNCLVEEQFGHTTDILIRRAFGNVYEVLLAGDEKQKKRWLLPAVQGERTCSICMTEPEAGSDATAIKTSARRDGEDWLLSGQKHFVSDGLYSDFFVVSAVTDLSAERATLNYSSMISDSTRNTYLARKDRVYAWPMKPLAISASPISGRAPSARHHGCSA